MEAPKPDHEPEKIIEDAEKIIEDAEKITEAEVCILMNIHYCFHKIFSLYITFYVFKL